MRARPAAVGRRSRRTAETSRGRDCTTEGGRPRLKRCVSVPILQLRVESVTLSLTQCWTVRPLFVLPGDPVQPMTSDRDERSIEDYDLGADGPDEHDWTEPVTKVANVVLFITSLHLLCLMFSFIMQPKRGGLLSLDRASSVSERRVGISSQGRDFPALNRTEYGRHTSSPCCSG